MIRNKIIFTLCATVMLSAMFPVPAAAASPRLLMTGYRIEAAADGGAVDAGDFILYYTLSNPSAVTVTDAVVSFDQRNTASMPVILPIPGSPNTEYVGSVPAGGEYKGSLALYVPRQSESGICRLDFTLSYSTADSSALFSSAFSIYVNIENAVEISVKNAELSNEAASGGRKRLLLEYENPGMRDYKNLTLYIDGNVVEQQKVQMLPILKAGKSNSIEYYIQFTETGEQGISVHIAYDDDDGNSYKTPVISLSAEVSEGGGGAGQGGTASEGFLTGLVNRMIRIMRTPETVAVILVLIVAAAAVAMIVPRARRKAKRKKWYYKNDNNGNGGRSP